jgi:hypothetical protein
MIAVIQDVVVDRDGNKETGYAVRNSDGDPIIGAEYCIVVVGKNGVVFNECCRPGDLSSPHLKYSRRQSWGGDIDCST